MNEAIATKLTNIFHFMMPRFNAPLIWIDTNRPMATVYKQESILVHIYRITIYFCPLNNCVYVRACKIEGHGTPNTVHWFRSEPYHTENLDVCDFDCHTSPLGTAATGSGVL